MRRAPILFPAMFVLCIACGGDDDAQPDARTTDAAAVDAGFATTTHYAPPVPGAGCAWGAVPYPSDLCLDEEGMLTLTSLPVGPAAQQDFIDMMLESLHTMDGAGVWSNVYLPVDGEVDPDTLAGHVVLLDLDHGNTVVPVDLVWRADLSAVVASPQLGHILLEKTRYGAYVTSGVTGADGAALQPGELFAEAADLSTVPSDAAVAAAQENIRPLLESLSPDVAAEVVSATVFKTETVTDDAVAMRDIVAADPPTVTVETVYDDAAGLDQMFGVQDPDAPVGMLYEGFRAQPHGHVAVLMHGTITLANFLSDTPGVDGLLSYDGDGLPVVKGHHPVKFTLILPVAADYEDLPVVFYVGGIDRTRIDMLVQADTAAKNGQALMAIDLAYHGDRATSPVDLMNDMTGEMEPDGFGDYLGLTPAIGFFHLGASGGIPGYHPQAMRENLRQAAIDICSLISFVARGDPSPISVAVGQTVSFHTDTTAVVTESFGALVTGVAIAIEPRLGVAFFSSPAAGMPFPSMIHSPTYSSLFMNAVTIPFDIGDRISLGDPVQGARFEPIVMLYDSALERGEPTAFAPYVMDGSLRGDAGPSLILTQAYSDERVPNDATEQYAKALGLDRVSIGNEANLPDPPLRYAPLDVISAPVSGNFSGGARTAGLVLYHPSSHASIRKKNDELYYEYGFPPFVELETPVVLDPTPIAELHAQWSALITEYFAGTGAPTIIDPYAD